MIKYLKYLFNINYNYNGGTQSYSVEDNYNISVQWFNKGHETSERSEKINLAWIRPLKKKYWFSHTLSQINVDYYIISKKIIIIYIYNLAWYY
jgi:hypothetical protein